MESSTAICAHERRWELPGDAGMEVTDLPLSLPLLLPPLMPGLLPVGPLMLFPGRCAGKEQNDGIIKAGKDL